MCRIADKGPYALGNIYCGTYKDNAGDKDLVAAMSGIRAYYEKNASWLKGTTGADHPRSKAVTTPAGPFPSLTAAAAHYGISRYALQWRLAKWGAPTKATPTFDKTS